MSNDFLLTLAAKLIPLMGLAFVGVLMCYKIYIKIRSKFDAKVNCWFCNENTKVPYPQTNSWTCPSCEQYNGFTRDGDYNREIYEQLDCSNLSGNKLNYSTGASTTSAASLASSKFSQNGFCSACNEAQRIKVEKLAQFEPKNESHFDEELKVYKEKLEKDFRLCDTCERHLKRVLRDKKKMVLGSKFLDFIMKGAETLKQPHFQHERQLHNQKWKRRCSTLITVLAVCNLWATFVELPPLGRDQVIGACGPTIGQPIFNILSHGIALWRVLIAYAQHASDHALYAKIALFGRTVFRMLLYSMGLKLSQIAEYTAASVCQSAAPFAILTLAFGYHVVDGMKLNRYTALLVLWSAFAGGLIKGQPLPLFVSSLVTFGLVVFAKADDHAKLLDNNSQSFHRIYSEDYLSDEDTISMLSQQFDCSSVSMRSLGSNHSAQRRLRQPAVSPRSSLAAPTTTPQFAKSPSMFALNQMGAQSRAQLSPNASFCAEDSRRSHYAPSMTNFSLAPTTQRSTLFTSNLELQRPQCTAFANDTCSLLNASFAESTLCAQASVGGASPRLLGAGFPSASSIPDYGQVYGSGCGMPAQQAANGGFAKPTTVPSGMHSPFSVSTHSAVYPERPASCLLAPSRFGPATNQASASTTSWLSGGYFNQQRPQPLHVNTALTATKGGMPASTFFDARPEENLSRSSSHSSGFESQTGGRPNVSRENSVCPDSGDTLQRSVSMDLGKAFQPIGSEPFSGTASAFVRRPPLHFVQPCAEADAFGRLSGHLGRGRGDSFNLRQINEELPSIKRGDLLRKWKDGQAVA